LKIQYKNLFFTAAKVETFVKIKICIAAKTNKTLIDANINQDSKLFKTNNSFTLILILISISGISYNLLNPKKGSKLMSTFLKKITIPHGFINLVIRRRSRCNIFGSASFQNQGCGSGYGFRDFVDPDPYWESGSRGKKTKKFQ
jgi:hypothetical protein